MQCPRCDHAPPPGSHFCNRCGAPLAPAPSETSAEVGGERRQLTVMFCDLVGSTELSQLIDPEELRDVLRAYQDACANEIHTYGGRIAQYLGDGLLVYFGYPQAHEDDPDRAVRAGLRIQQEMPRLRARLSTDIPSLHDFPIEARIAIHTGPVVVGEVGGREKLALGDTLNIAARLQEVAEPGGVVIGDRTRRLVSSAYVLDDLGQHDIRGLSEPMGVSRVLRAREVQSRFELAAAAGLTPLVGREDEIALLRTRFDRARDGMGQVVLVNAEAGMGKSRLAHAFREQLAGESVLWLECRGSPFRESSAFHPVIDLIERSLDMGPDVSLAERIARLGSALERSKLDAKALLPLFTDLLSLPDPGSEAPALGNPEARRRETLDALCDWILEQPNRRPTVLVMEDLHWVDPSTLELLGLLIDAMAEARILLLLVFRPEFEPPWAPRPSATSLTLGSLERPQVVRMVEGLVGGAPVPNEILEQLIAKTDGVPLFVEELTKNVLESGVLDASLDPLERRRRLPDLAIPSTLQDSLMARLDRMGRAKEVAQVASVLGREFTSEQLQGVMGVGANTLEPLLERLVEAQLLYRSGDSPSAVCSFKHALIQDTAYQSLLKRRRQQCHARVAQVLEERFPELAEAQPDVLARHHEESGAIHEAIEYRQRAGELATRRSANLEAIQHLTRGIELLQSLAEDPLRDEREALLQLALGVPLQAARGYADPAVEAAYRRTRELCRDGSSPELLFRALWGLFQHYNSRAELKTATELSGQLLELAHEGGDPSQILLAHAVSGAAHFWRGEPERAVHDAEQVHERYDPDLHAALTFSYGQDPGVAARAYGACALAQLGDAERGKRWIGAALELGAQCVNRFDHAFALGFASIFHTILHERERVRRRAEEGVALSTEIGFPLWRGVCRLLANWAVAGDPGVSGVVDGVRRGMMEQVHTGNRAGAPMGMGLLGEVYLLTGDLEHAADAIETGLGMSRQSGTHAWDPELHRVRGEIRLAAMHAELAEAERCFRLALESAASRGMRTFELRASNCLARLALARDEPGAARRILEPICATFPDSLDTADLRDARAILEQTTGGSA